MSSLFLKSATVAFVVSLGLGLYMAIGHDHALFSVHAHVALLGWVSMALFAIAYRVWPQLAGGPVVTAHFWLYTVGFGLSMLGLTLLELAPSPAAEPLAGVGSMALTAGALCFLGRVLAVGAEQEPASQR